MGRNALKLLFCAFEVAAFLAAFFLLRGDWRNPANRGFENILGIILGASCVAIAVISFALRRTHKNWTNAGVITILALLIIGMLMPAQ